MPNPLTINQINDDIRAADDLDDALDDAIAYFLDPDDFDTLEAYNLYHDLLAVIFTPYASELRGG